MRRCLSALLVVLAGTASAQAHGLLIPVEKKLPPLAMLNHQVQIAIEDQVALTKVEQTFRNHTDRALEATYIFPVPRGASVRKFSMWVGDKEVPGELVEAAKAKQIYTDIVRRTQDPGLLEYMGNNLLKLSVFPVPAKGDQKISLSYTSVASSDSGLIEYVYPLRTDGKAASTLEKFAINISLKSQHPLQNIYSPSHAIAMTRPNDRQAQITFEKDQAVLDKDFQLFYAAGGKDVGLTALAHRPSPGLPGYCLLLISPREELSREHQVPRDMIFVLDTSGSMRGKRMTQARSALKYCLSQLTANDRFALLNFATTVNKYTEQLLPADVEQVARARKWVDDLEATGGTAINDALKAALEMRTSDSSRPFTIVFFTDGRPTIGETDTDKIQKNVLAKNSANTRIFTFGVGDDVNASFLDQLAEGSRAISTYVREAEDIEAKVSSLYSKISNPVLTNLKLTVGDDVKLSEVYPPQLPDLFHGTQMVVLGRYSGQGHVAVRLTGSVGKDAREYVYEMTFADKTGEDKTFVEDLWARRKVGYLLDQIRANGEKKELVEEVTALAKRYGITTPYTSYLIVPDAPVPVVGRQADRPDVAFNLNGRGGQGWGALPPALQGPVPGGAPVPVQEYLKRVQNAPGEGATSRATYSEKELDKAADDTKGKADVYSKAIQATRDRLATHNQANAAFRGTNKDTYQAGKLGVDLACEASCLRNQSQMTQTALRCVQNRNCLEVGGVWIDEGYDVKMKTVTIKAMSTAYFRLLERQPAVRDVLRLGNHLVWVTPSGTALIVDAGSGLEEMADNDIDALFVAGKKG